jgi:hypothetical protein
VEKQEARPMQSAKFSPQYASQQQSQPIVKKNSLDAAQFDCLLKAIELAHKISSSPSTIVSGSRIISQLSDGTSILQIDMTKALNQKLRLCFINTENEIKLLANLKNSKKIQILDDPSLDFYEVTNQQFSVPLYKRYKPTTSDVTPDPSKWGMIGVPAAIKETKVLRSQMEFSSLPFVSLHIFNNQLTAVQVPGYQSYLLDPAALDECAGTPEISLKSFSFLDVPGEEITMKVRRDNTEYWLITETPIALGVTANLFEPLLVENKAINTKIMNGGKNGK